jgi:hypothetical protein
MFFVLWLNPETQRLVMMKRFLQRSNWTGHERGLCEELVRLEQETGMTSKHTLRKKWLEEMTASTWQSFLPARSCRGMWILRTPLHLYARLRVSVHPYAHQRTSPTRAFVAEQTSRAIQNQKSVYPTQNRDIKTEFALASRIHAQWHYMHDRRSKQKSICDPKFTKNSDVRLTKSPKFWKSTIRTSDITISKLSNLILPDFKISNLQSAIPDSSNMWCQVSKKFQFSVQTWKIKVRSWVREQNACPITLHAWQTVRLCAKFDLRFRIYLTSIGMTM